MNEKQSHELQELSTLEAAGTLEEAQKGRLEELKSFKAIAEKASEADKFSKDFQTAEAQKKHFREKFEAEEKTRKELEAKLNAGGSKEGLKVEDFIDISASLEGLDQAEKVRISREHKLTGKPLSEIRKDEDFLLWQSAYRQKVEKDKTVIKPTNKQSDDDSPMTLEEALKGKTPDEQAKILEDTIGYSVGKKSGSDRRQIGN